MLVRSTPLVGRTVERNALATALRESREGRGGTVFLVGEAGIGKSRLAAHFMDEARQCGMRVVRGRASELGSAVPFRPIAEVVLGLSRSGAAPRATELAPYRRSLGWLVPDWGPAGAIDADDRDCDRLLVLAEAVLRLVAHVTRDHACLIVLEDLHGADPETLAVVEYLSDNLASHAVLLLATVRAEPCAALELAHAATRRGGTNLVELSALSDDEVGELAADRLGVRPNAIPPSVLARLTRGCAGNPFLAEEILNDLTTSGALARRGDQWWVVGELPVRAPASIVNSIAQRADRLGARAVLRVGAMLGQRFPLEVVQRVTGMDDQILLPRIQAAIVAQLLVPDGQSSDWYAFRHALTAEALRGELRPGARAELARRIADAVEQCYPDLSGSWCQLAAELRLAAGDSTAAGRLLLTAGQRALAAGAAASAVTLLERARTLLSDGADLTALADALEALLYALLEIGQIDKALAFATTLDPADRSFGPLRQAALHSHLAWVAALAGRVDVGLAQLAIARSLAGDMAGDRHLAPIDAVAGYLALDSARSDNLVMAEELGQRAAAAAERVPLPVVACQAWQLLGIVARSRSADDAARCFRRMAAIAAEYRLPIWRIRARAFMAVNDALMEGRTDSLARARDEAKRGGAVAFAHGLETNLALMSVLRGEWDRAEALIEECWPAAVRQRFHDIVRYGAVARAALAAHQGRRVEMERAVADFRHWGGADSNQLPMMLGMCQAMCALLEEDADAAFTLLARSGEHEANRPGPFLLAGRHGLQILLRAMRGEIGLSEFHQGVDAAPCQARWNRQFALLAQAVLLGRAGQANAAAEVVARARVTAMPFPMARHLGARLVAPAALADGWGEPVTWLREAEEYFYTTGVAAVASACRALLRGAGARVHQRRAGHGRVPEALRLAGVTGREFEVLELVVERWGNQQIAQRLHISPRTVEKHVASLVRKTGQVDRTALMAFVADHIAAAA